MQKNAAKGTWRRQKRFGEHRRSILNYGHFANPAAPVSEHFNQANYSIKDVLLIRSNRDWLCQKGTQGSRPHQQSYDNRISRYK